MKKIITAAIAACLLLNTGCSGFLDEDLKKELTPDKTYTSTYGFEVGITGLYGLARSEFNTWGGSFATHAQACPYEALQVATDIVYAGAGDGSLLPFEKLSYSSATTFVNSYWNYCYGMIASANEILTYSENADVRWDNAGDKVRFQAEARFFRAYAYRYLVYLYGDVPYVEKIEESFRLDFTRTKKEEVMDHMIKDMEFAAANLEQDPDKVVPGRLTKWAVKHLLTEVYMMAGKYAEAEATAREIINSGHFSLMTERFGVEKDLPGDPFSDLFVEHNPRRTNGNKEAIWIMPLEYNTTGGGGSNEDWTRRAWVPQYFKLPGFVLADTLGGRGLAQIVPFKWWVQPEKGDAEFFTPGDIRNSGYNIKRDWYYNDPDNKLFGQKVEITDSLWSNALLCPTVTKFFYGKEDNLSYNGTNKDRTKARLAETYLFLAEACLKQNKAEEAAKAINVVRERAGAPAITAGEATIDFLLDERIRELVGEELRRLTLIRFDKLLDRTQKYNPHSKHIKEHHKLWPIPQAVIDSNIDAPFPQNPGY